MADEKNELPDYLKKIEAEAQTMWVYSPTSGSTTGHNVNEMSVEQMEQLLGRIRSGELVKVNNEGDRPDGIPDDVVDPRPLRQLLLQPAGSVMAPRQGVDLSAGDLAKGARTAQELADDAPREVAAEHQAVTEMHPLASADEAARVKQEAGVQARVEGATATSDSSPGPSVDMPRGARQTARNRSAKAGSDKNA